jgi:undecaprenyl-diphosphatase
MNDFIDIIESLDHRVTLFINSLNNSFLDDIMWLISSTSFGIPFYILFVFLLIRIYNPRQIIFLILALILVVSLCDLSAKYFFKEVFERYRPSHNLIMKDQLHLVNNYSGGKYGFVSSHAANMAGLSTMVYFFLKQRFSKIGYLLVPFVLLVSYSRVYLGVHYVSDVFVGMFLGFLISFTLYKFIKKIKILKI